MSNRKNIYEKIQQERKHINPYYDATYQELNSLLRHSGAYPFIYGVNCFTFGYMQGYKAALSELKKADLTASQKSFNDSTEKNKFNK